MKISVITVNYNDAVGLERTIRSVKSQTSIEKEFIIVDGASTDGSVEVIQKYLPDISRWVSEPDSGIYNAMNKGVRMATGDYCIMMNSGDAFLSNEVLETVSEKLKSNKDIYNGNALYVKDGKYIEWYRKGHKDISVLHFFRSSICHQSTFIKTSLMLDNPYDETLKMVSDWKFWVQTICVKHVSYEAIDVDVCCFDTGGMTTTHRDLGYQERRKVLSEFFTKEEIENYDRVLQKRDWLKYLREGSEFHLLLIFARLFKVKYLKHIYG